MTDRGDRPTVVVVGSGGQPYREYAFAALAERYRVGAVLGAEPTWQRPYLADAAVADLADPSSIAGAVRSLAGGTAGLGVMTWDETVLLATAEAAEQLGLPHLSAGAAAACRDKYATRSRLAGTPLGVRHRLVGSADEAVEAAESFGYPVVVKPRSLAGSVGVARAEDAAAVRQAFARTATSRYATLEPGLGALVEELLEGPEVSVDSVVFDGEVQCAHVARKRLGFAPYFEEVGHLVTGWAGEPWADEAREVVVAAHGAVGVDHGVTHTELRLTAGGPRLVELNGRLGGDLIPFVSRLATGVDLVVAAAEMALGRPPSCTPAREGTAEVRFVYPPYDCVVRSVDVAAAARVPGIAHATVLPEPGARLRLPPADPIPRLAALVAVGADAEECRQALDRAEAAVVADIEPLAGPG